MLTAATIATTITSAKKQLLLTALLYIKACFIFFILKNS